MFLTRDSQTFLLCSPILTKAFLCDAFVDDLDKWFLTIFTCLTLLSNKIARFTPNALSGVHLLKIPN